MLFTIGVITRCAGNNHYHIPVTIGGTTKTVETDLAELQAVKPNTIEEIRTEVVGRIRSALLEANAATFAQAGVALNNKPFHI